MASKKTAETERGAERLMEAIEVYQAYLEELSVHRVECKRSGKDVPTPPLPGLSKLSTCVILNTFSFEKNLLGQKDKAKEHCN